MLAVGVVSKDIIHHSSLAGGVAGSRATEFIIAVLTLYHKRATTAVSHADEQVTLRLVGLRERHAVGLAEGLQQIRTRKVLSQKSYPSKKTCFSLFNTISWRKLHVRVTYLLPTSMFN